MTILPLHKVGVEGGSDRPGRIVEVPRVTLVLDYEKSSSILIAPLKILNPATATRVGLSSCLIQFQNFPATIDPFHFFSTNITLQKAIAIAKQARKEP